MKIEKSIWLKDGNLHIVFVCCVDDDGRSVVKAGVTLKLMRRKNEEWRIAKLGSDVKIEDLAELLNWVEKNN